MRWLGYPLGRFRVPLAVITNLLFGWAVWYVAILALENAANRYALQEQYNPPQQQYGGNIIDIPIVRQQNGTTRTAFILHQHQEL